MYGHRSLFCAPEEDAASVLEIDLGARLLPERLSVKVAESDPEASLQAQAHTHTHTQAKMLVHRPVGAVGAGLRASRVPQSSLSYAAIRC